MLKQTILLLFLLICQFGYIKAQIPPEYIGVSTVKSDVLDFSQIEFKQLQSSNIPFENSQTFTVLKFKITNFQEFDRVLVKLSSPSISVARLYDSIPFNSRHYSASGTQIKSSDRFYNDPFPVFLVKIKKGEERVLYLAVKSEFSSMGKPEILSVTEFEKYARGRNIFYGIFIGMMLLMFLYNLIVYLLTKDKNFLIYIGYVFFMYWAQANQIGTSYYSLGDYPLLSKLTFFVGSGIAAIFASLFIRNFLNTKKYSPILNTAITVLIVLYGIQVVLCLTGNFELSFRAIQFNGFLLFIIFGSIAIKQTIEKRPFALLYLLAWSPLLIGLIVTIMRDFGVFAYNDFTNYIFPVAILLETVLLSLALAHQINRLKSDNIEANQRLISEVQKNEELIRDQNVTLEKKVIERTAELQKALDELKETQSQLVQSEKMASLGTLTAGIAHEINNPINFVTANVIPLRDNIDGVQKLLEEYRRIDGKNLESELQRLEELEKSMDLDYTLKETSELIDGIEEGARRTHVIVDGLTTFSRGDSSEKSQSDINKGITSTISVLKSRLNKIDFTIIIAG